MQVPWGEGRVTVLADTYFMTTDAIGDRDHAELVHRLALREPGTPVWIVVGDAWPSPWQLAQRHAWMILVSLGALLLAWLAAVVRRLGPLIPDTSVERRSLMEHVEASGRFLWRRGARAELLAAVRRALRDRIQQRHPGWMRLPKAELHRALAKRAGLRGADVARALEDPTEPGPERFEHAVRTLDRLSREL